MLVEARPPESLRIDGDECSRVAKLRGFRTSFQAVLFAVDYPGIVPSHANHQDTDNQREHRTSYHVEASEPREAYHVLGWATNLARLWMESRPQNIHRVTSNPSIGVRLPFLQRKRMALLWRRRPKEWRPALWPSTGSIHASRGSSPSLGVEASPRHLHLVWIVLHRGDFMERGTRKHPISELGGPVDRAGPHEVSTAYSPIQTLECPEEERTQQSRKRRF